MNLPPIRLFVAGALLALCCAADAPPATRAAKVRIALAGDSTVTDSVGWGKGLAKCFTEDVQVINFSRSGRSSRSFIREGAWQKVLDAKPDYVLIQFGHNDSPGHPGDRETDPQTSYKKFMTQYVDDARSTGIKPVLVTSLSRRQWGADGKIHSTLMPYVEVVKQVAADKHVPLIDLHARSVELYEKLGQDAVRKLEPMKKPESATTTRTASDAPAVAATTRPVVPDATHLNSRGSDVIGRVVAEGLAAAVPDLARYLREPM